MAGGEGRSGSSRGQRAILMAAVFIRMEKERRRRRRRRRGEVEWRRGVVRWWR